MAQAAPISQRLLRDRVALVVALFVTLGLVHRVRQDKVTMVAQLRGLALAVTPQSTDADS